MNKTFKYFFRIFVILISTGLLAFTFFSTFNSYDEFINLILQHTGKSDKINKFKNEFLSYHKFLVIRLLSQTIFVFFTILIIKQYKNFENKVFNLLNSLYQSLKSAIKKNTKTDWLVFSLIFIITTGIKIFYFFNQPVTNDEAFTFLNYVKPGFLAAISYYNLTNNHILHSLLCNVFDLLPFSPVYTLRIASFITGLLVLFFAFILFSELFKRKAKYVAFTFFSFGFPVMQYGFLARGYSLLLLFTIITTSVLLKICKNGSANKTKWCVYIVSSSLGFYSIPVYLYVFIAQTVFFTGCSFWLNKSIKQLYNFLKISSVTGILTLLLYSPVLLINGITSLTGYDFMQPLPISEFFKSYPSFIQGYFIWLSGDNTYFGLFMFMIVIFSMVYSFRHKKVLFILLLSYLLTPVILTGFQQIQLFYRVLIFNTLSLSIALGIFTEFFLNKIRLTERKKNIILLLASIFMSIILITSFTQYCKEQKQINLKAYRFAGFITNHSSIFSTNQVRYYTFLKFKAEYLEQKQIKLFRNHFDKNYPYDFISEDIEKDEHYAQYSKYRYLLIYKDEYIRLYRLVH